MMPPELAILPILTGTASGLILWLTTWLEFRQIKAGDDAHWTERASELFPVLQSARSNVWCVPTVVSLVVAWNFPTPGFLDVLNWFAGVTGAFWGTRPLDRWRGKVPQARRGVLTVLAQGLVGIAGWLVLVGGVVLVPPQWEPTVGWIFLGALVLHISLACGGGIWLSKAFGWMRMADSATCEIVKRLASARAQRPPELLQVDSPDANAVAVAGGRYVLLVGPMTSLLSLSELETILSHELAHTREGWVVVAGRILGSMSMFALDAHSAAGGRYRHYRANDFGFGNARVAEVQPMAQPALRAPGRFVGDRGPRVVSDLRRGIAETSRVQSHAGNAGEEDIHASGSLRPDDRRRHWA
jgi:hypothetical protein